jgi:hypothetical protein
MAIRGKLDMLDGEDAFKVLLYSLASAVVTSLIAWIAQVNLPTEWLAFVPIVNVILVSIKNLIENR